MIVDVGVVVNLLVMVTGIVRAYDVVLADVDFGPYLVVQSFAVE